MFMLPNGKLNFATSLAPLAPTAHSDLDDGPPLSPGGLALFDSANIMCALHPGPDGDRLGPGRMDLKELRLHLRELYGIGRHHFVVLKKPGLPRLGLKAYVEQCRWQCDEVAHPRYGWNREPITDHIMQAIAREIDGHRPPSTLCLVSHAGSYRSLLAMAVAAGWRFVVAGLPSEVSHHLLLAHPRAEFLDLRDVGLWTPEPAVHLGKRTKPTEKQSQPVIGA